MSSAECHARKLVCVAEERHAAWSRLGLALFEIQGLIGKASREVGLEVSGLSGLKHDTCKIKGRVADEQEAALVALITARQKVEELTEAAAS